MVASHPASALGRGACICLHSHWEAPLLSSQRDGWSWGGGGGGGGGASWVLQAFPGPQPCREGDLCQEVSGIFGEGGPSSVGIACHWAPSLRPGPSPTHTPAHLIGLAGESRSAAETWPTSVPGALFSGTAR